MFITVNLHAHLDSSGELMRKDALILVFFQEKESVLMIQSFIVTPHVNQMKSGELMIVHVLKSALIQEKMIVL
jgi:hypothetical protein